MISYYDKINYDTLFMIHRDRPAQIPLVDAVLTLTAPVAV